jgi:hypothetical protein
MAAAQALLFLKIVLGRKLDIVLKPDSSPNCVQKTLDQERAEESKGIFIASCAMTSRFFPAFSGSELEQVSEFEW